MNIRLPDNGVLSVNNGLKASAISANTIDANMVVCQTGGISAKVLSASNTSYANQLECGGMSISKATGVVNIDTNGPDPDFEDTLAGGYIYFGSYDNETSSTMIGPNGVLHSTDGYNNDINIIKWPLSSGRLALQSEISSAMGSYLPISSSTLVSTDYSNGLLFKVHGGITLSSGGATVISSATTIKGNERVDGNIAVYDTVGSKSTIAWLGSTFYNVNGTSRRTGSFWLVDGADDEVDVYPQKVNIYRDDEGLDYDLFFPYIRNGTFVLDSMLSAGDLSSIVLKNELRIKKPDSWQATTSGPVLGFDSTSNLSVGGYLELQDPVTGNESWLHANGIWKYEHPELPNPGAEINVKWPSTAGTMVTDVQLSAGTLLPKFSSVSATTVRSVNTYGGNANYSGTLTFGTQHRDQDTKILVIGEWGMPAFELDVLKDDYDDTNKPILSMLDGEGYGINFLPTIGRLEYATANGSYVFYYPDLSNSPLTADGTYVLATTSMLSDYALTSHTHANYVPTSRKVNNKQLSSDITLGAADVGAVSLGGDEMTGELINDIGLVSPYWSTTIDYHAGIAATNDKTSLYVWVDDSHEIYIPATTQTTDYFMLSSHVPAAVRYQRNAPAATGNTPTITLADRCMNVVSLASTVTAVTINVPANSCSGCMRDMFLNLTITSTGTTTVTMKNNNSAMTISFGSADLAKIVTGKNLIYITEVDTDKFLVSVKHED